MIIVAVIVQLENSCIRSLFLPGWDKTASLVASREGSRSGNTAAACHGTPVSPFRPLLSQMQDEGMWAKLLESCRLELMMCLILVLGKDRMTDIWLAAAETN